MAEKISTGARTYALNSGLNTAWDSGFCDVYTGSQPSSADDAPSGTLLASLAFPADGFNAAASGAMALASTITGTAAATGTAGWFRLRQSSDAGGSSTTLRRLDGAVTATSGGGEIELDSTSITSGQTVSVSTLTITQPAS